MSRRLFLRACTRLLVLAAGLRALSAQASRDGDAEPNGASPGAPPLASLTLQAVSVGRETSGSWVLRGNVNVSLSLALVAAIERGVTLQFESIFRAERSRWYWLPEQVYSQTRVGRLTFHPITRLFRVRLDGNPPRTFSDLTEALRYCLVVRGWQVAPAGQELADLDLRLRLRLDKSALPKSLQISAFMSDDWNLSTGWVTVSYDPVLRAPSGEANGG